LVRMALTIPPFIILFIFLAMNCVISFGLSQNECRNAEVVLLSVAHFLKV
jgi:hypothetical protein